MGRRASPVICRYRGLLSGPSSEHIVLQSRPVSSSPCSPTRAGFLVTDGHPNRVLRVKLNGDISEVIAFPDIVPTGLALRGKDGVCMTEAGPVPHLPENGKIVAFTARSPAARVVASGAPLLVDVEFGNGHSMYALSQGHFTPGHPEGSPADPDTGALERVNKDGTR